MKRTFVLTVVIFVFCSVISVFAAEPGKKGQMFPCPRSIAVDVTIKTASAIGGWDSMPAQSRFTLAIKEGAVRGNSMICHYTNGTVDYNLTRVFPQGKTCYIAPSQSFMCQ